jgi:hypothetical protein
LYGRLKLIDLLRARFRLSRTGAHAASRKKDQRYR